MTSMWSADSDRDYYNQIWPEEEDDEPETWPAIPELHEITAKVVLPSIPEWERKDDDEPPF